MSEDPQKLQEMVTLYKQGLLVNPKDVRKRFQLAAAYHKLGDLPKAIKEYENARKTKGDHFGCRLGLGRAYLEDGQVPEAVAALKEAVAIKPDNSDVHHLLGDVALQAEDHAAAADAFTAVTRLEASDDPPGIGRAHV